MKIVLHKDYTHCNLQVQDILFHTWEVEQLLSDRLVMAKKIAHLSSVYKDKPDTVSSGLQQR